MNENKYIIKFAMQMSSDDDFCSKRFEHSTFTFVNKVSDLKWSFQKGGRLQNLTAEKIKYRIDI